MAILEARPNCVHLSIVDLCDAVCARYPDAAAGQHDEEWVAWAEMNSAIIEFRLPVTPHGTHNSVIVCLDPEKMGEAVGISLLSCLQADTCLVVSTAAPGRSRSRRTLLFPFTG